ncbi:uncharacterized protein [Spinacia oleracea]|uniref:Uncharacterized protein isoform X2 n=1 Tax=Spinacia oleracea TaxID=3562 RepID=A0A9R0KAE9_SPIOL|nr:uncharacterized protein LOC110803411 isoform X2 [Spinacia oleracea]
MNKTQGEIGFFCPKRLSMVTRRSSTFTSYLTHSISKQSKKQFIFITFHQKSHWMLILLCLQRGEAFLFASVGVGLDSVQVKGHISMSYRTWQANNKGSQKSLRWKEIICSREPEMSECGYYVMKYMYQIVLLGLQSISNVEEIFSPNPYTQEEIDDVREKWSRYFISSCL